MRVHRKDKGLGDAHFAEQAIAHSPRAVELAYDRWGQVTYSVALALVSSPAAGQDIVLAVFLTLWREPELVAERYLELQSFPFEAVVHRAHDLHYGQLAARQGHSAHEASNAADSSALLLHMLDEPSPEYRARARRHSFFNPVWREYG